MHIAHPTTSIPAVKKEMECDAAIQEVQQGGEAVVEQGGERNGEDLAMQEQSRSRDKEMGGSASHVKDTKAGVARVDTDVANVTEGEAYQGYRAEQGCPYCGKTFHRRSRFIRHLNYHLGNRSFLVSHSTI